MRYLLSLLFLTTALLAYQNELWAFDFSSSLPSIGSVKDTDGDGLKDAHDLCPTQSDSWYLVPKIWVARDENHIADVNSDWILETVDGQTAKDVKSALNQLVGVNPLYKTNSIDDLGENLALITVTAILNDGKLYIYDEIKGINKWSDETKNQAANMGSTYIQDPLGAYFGIDDPEEVFGETVVSMIAEDLGYDYETYTVNYVISTDTKFAGVIQKDCSNTSPNR